MDRQPLQVTSFSKELNLMLALIKNDRDSVKILLNSSINWYVFLEVVKQHRVYPIIYKKLNDEFGKEIPQEIQVKLRGLYQQNTFQMMKMSAEMESLSDCFQKQEIRCLFLKGPALAYQLYRNLSMRTSNDLDVLISLKDFKKADALLIERGYERDEYKRSVLGDWKWKNHHVEYMHPDTLQKIELHWKLHPGGAKEPSFDQLWNRKQASTLTKKTTYLLGTEDLYVFLMIHGARHGWFRLRWLVDLADLSKQITDWRLIKKMKHSYQVSHIAGQVGLLAEELLDTKLPLYGHVTERSYRLAEDALFLIINEIDIHDDRLSRRFLKRADNYYQSIMTRRQKVFRFYGALYPCIDDAKTLPLPKSLHFLYFPLRPFLWMWRQLVIVRGDHG